jgi:hypothetical protein
MTHKNSILELILTEEHRYRANVYRCKKKKFDVTILTQVVIGILDLWNASTYLSISQKTAIRPIVPIDL